MARKNGTGPGAFGQGRSGRKTGGPKGAGPGGHCICPSCGNRVAQERGHPCYKIDCHKCGTKMLRE